MVLVSVNPMDTRPDRLCTATSSTARIVSADSAYNFSAFVSNHHSDVLDFKRAGDVPVGGLSAGSAPGTAAWTCATARKSGQN